MCLLFCAYACLYLYLSSRTRLCSLFACWLLLALLSVVRGWCFVVVSVVFNSWSFLAHVGLTWAFETHPAVDRAVLRHHPRRFPILFL